MNEIMKFESTPIEAKKINGVWMFELYSVGMALGYARGNGKSSGEHGVHPDNKKLFPYKSRIDKVCENAEIKPVSHGVNRYLNESQLYDFMLEARTDKCRAFRKWLTNEVLPALNHKGTYSIHEQNEAAATESECTYEYHDKFLNGEPVLTTEDFVHITGLSRGYVSWYLRKPDFRKGIDYHLLSGERLSKFKQQNPSISKCASEMYLITKSGFYKLCEAGGIKLSEPQCFIEQKNLPKAKEPKTSKNSQLLYVINQMRKSLGIQTIPLDRATADALGYRGNSITGQAIMYREKDGDLRLFMDFDSDEYEKAFMVLQNIGRVILGQFRKSKDCVPVGESERFTQESRMFAAAYLAQYVFAQTFPAPPMTGFNE